MTPSALLVGLSLLLALALGLHQLRHLRAEAAGVAEARRRCLGWLRQSVADHLVLMMLGPAGGARLLAAWIAPHAHADLFGAAAMALLTGIGALPQGGPRRLARTAVMAFPACYAAIAATAAFGGLGGWTVWLAVLLFRRLLMPLWPPTGMPAVPETGITELCRRAGRPGLPVFFRGAGANACAVGMGRWARIRLDGGLVDLLAPAELRAVVAHELGHLVRNHHVSYCLAAGLAGLPLFLLSDGLDMAPTGRLLLLQAGAPVLRFLVGPIHSAFRRHLELDADAYASRLVGAEALGAALLRLDHAQPHQRHHTRAFAFWCLTHPPLAVRLGRLGQASRDTATPPAPTLV